MKRPNEGRCMKEHKKRVDTDKKKECLWEYRELFDSKNCGKADTK